MSWLTKNKNNYILLLVLLFISLIPTVVSAASDDAIKGSMTEAQYKEKYSTLNQQQNEAWNAKYNFRPETNVVRVKTLNQFIDAFENNNVSKIILENNIRDTTTTGKSYRRTESIEIDGQGYLLELVHSSLNVDDLMKLSDFTRKFSDVPVFHMHDIQIANNKGYGEKEGNLSHAWSFVNGRGEWGADSLSGLARGERGLWRYRIGNVYTPYDTSKETDNQRVGGRLIGGNNGEISVWGYNKIITGAENFYTGGMIYEPYTYYRGEIADYNYSTIWFILNPISVTDVNNKGNMTGDQKFVIGDNSFVYLHNTNTGKSFPAVYEHYTLIDVGENATYNANVSGTAVSFNESGAKFVARKNAKVNLLSRSSGAPTISLIHSNSTHSTGSTTPPNNTSYTINEDAEFYVVGTNNNAYQGIVNYGYDGYSDRVSGKLIMNSPQAFDIRNMHKTNFLGRGDASDLFSVTNSDISLWTKGSDLNGYPQIDTNNVQAFSVIPSGTNGTVNTTDSKLYGYTRTNYQRISGFNAAPELLWEPITDADNTQKARVLLGYVPAGGSNPFDQNGDAIVVPVYADGNRVVEADLSDTLGNTFTSKTQSDGYLYWNAVDHGIKGFQIAGQNVSGKPFRLDSNKNRYREGEEASTVVVDVTPPEPTKVTSGVTTVSKKLTGTAEPFSKVTITINGVNQGDMITTTNAQGNWELAVPSNRLKKNDKVQIFLEDNALEIKSDKAYANANGLAYLPADRIPSTNSATGNKNPKTDLKYSDTTFKAATIVTVTDVAPPTPKIDKIARSLTTDGKENQIPQTESGNAKPEEWQGTVTKVNNTLSYRIVVQIPGTTGSEVEKVLYNAKITDQIPENLTFNKDDVKAWKYKKSDATTGLPIRYENNVVDSNGKHQFNMGDIDLVSSEATLLNDAIVNYDETSRLLTVGIGETNGSIGDKYGYAGSNEYGYLLPGDKVVIEFPTTVTSKAAKKTIKNTATVSGFSAEEISESPLAYKEISATSTEVINPGGVVTGELTLVSAPDTLNFGTTNLIDYNKAIGSDKSNIDQPLIVRDTLKDKNWKVTVNLLTDLSYQDGTDLYELPNSLYVRYKGENTPLSLHSPTTIYESDIDSMPNGKEEFNISDSWSKELDKDGIKMKASKVPTAATYSGDLEWSLTNTQ